MEIGSSKGMELWFLALVLVIFVSVARVYSQLDDRGYISIDCGLDANSSYKDIRNLTYVSDDQFIDTGVNYKISSQFPVNNNFTQFRTVRSFPNGSRNCYTLRSITNGTKYLVRGEFMYGNYDKLNKPPIFDLHLGINYWSTVNITTPASTTLYEIIATATSDYLQVCLINTNQGTPFISALELRPLGTTFYDIVNSTQSLVYFFRMNLGASLTVRFPDDPYDRIWIPYIDETWTILSTSSTLNSDEEFATPSVVMQTAATTSNTTETLDMIPWSWDDKSTKLYVILHYREIGNISSTDHREFNVYAEGSALPNVAAVPSKSYSGWVTYTDSGKTDYNMSLKATSKSTLPPLLNAFELFSIMPATGIPTNGEDVMAINAIKANYKVNKGWSGDPCVPTELSWTGITCTSDSTNIPRITALNLSSSGLTGAIISSFGNLSALKSLDISYNDFSGDLPTFLDTLSALAFLDITGNNKISTTLPPGLQTKKQEGNLIFRYGSAAKTGGTAGNDAKKKSLAVIIAVVAGVVLLLITSAVIIIVYLRRRSKQIHEQPKPKESGERVLDFENRRFNYNDLVTITNNFQSKIGTGGFGSVYKGALENGAQVAVKMRSHSSPQGVKEFLAEAKNLGKVHHRNLVSLIGYCMDSDCMALVYENMQEGSLQNKLKDDTRPLSWKQRVRIAYESALGLEYLHKACNPPLIHRDVKTSNILLNENLEARIADFGLSRAFNNAASTHVSSAVVGTPGYLDPGYYSTYQLSDKSDVYSFGVVLLEIVTGQPPIISSLEGVHLKDWVNQKLSRGDIESIVDPRMNGHYDINSVWKVTDLACKCTEDSSTHRPTMNDVVMELKESLDLAISNEGTH